MGAKRRRGDFNFVEVGLQAGAVAGSELGQHGATIRNSVIINPYV